MTDPTTAVANVTSTAKNAYDIIVRLKERLLESARFRNLNFVETRESAVHWEGLDPGSEFFAFNSTAAHEVKIERIGPDDWRATVDDHRAKILAGRIQAKGGLARYNLLLVRGRDPDIIHRHAEWFRSAFAWAARHGIKLNTNIVTIFLVKAPPTSESVFIGTRSGRTMHISYSDPHLGRGDGPHAFIRQSLEKELIADARKAMERYMQEAAAEGDVFSLSEFLARFPDRRKAHRYRARRSALPARAPDFFSDGSDHIGFA